jgi:tripartite ATP-independent transporter DctM subunit
VCSSDLEAGVIAVVYAFVVGLFIYKEFSLKDVPHICIEAAGGTSMVMLMIATASILGWIIAYAKLPVYVINMITAVTDNPTLILLLIIAFIMFLGIFVETIPATIIVSPILAPLVVKFGFDPIYFGFIIVCILVFASITPPVGGILNITMGIGRCKMEDLMPFITPYVGVMFFVVILVVFFPGLATYLPSVFIP